MLVLLPFWPLSPQFTPSLSILTRFSISSLNLIVSWPHFCPYCPWFPLPKSRKFGLLVYTEETYPLKGDLAHSGVRFALSLSFTLVWM